MADEKINILIASDINYAPYYGVMLTSLFINNAESSFDIYLITDDTWTNKETERFDRLCAKYSSDFHVRIIEDIEMANKFPIGKHLNRATYYNLNIANLLPETVHRVIYMDGDMIVNGSLKSLWELDLEDKACGMVVGPMWLEDDVYHRLEYDKKWGYYNNGTTLYDLDYIRKIDFSKHAVEYILKNADKLEMMDQDTTNVLLHEKIMRIPVQYNFQVKLFWESHWKGYTEAFRNELVDAAKQPIIIHYSDRRKPWQLIYSGMPYAKIWNKYYRLSEWHGEKTIGAPFIKYCKHLVKRVIKPTLIVSNFIPDVYKYLDK